MNGAPLQRTWRTDGATAEVRVRLDGGRLEGSLTRDGISTGVACEVHRAGDRAVVVRLAGRAHRAVIVRRGSTTWVALDGEVFALEAAGEAPERAGGVAEPFATSPMTGVLAKVAVAPGDRVAAGQELFVVEAMKMEFSVKAPRDVLVRSVSGGVGDRVGLGDTVVHFEEEA